MRPPLSDDCAAGNRGGPLVPRRATGHASTSSSLRLKRRAPDVLGADRPVHPRPVRVLLGHCRLAAIVRSRSAVVHARFLAWLIQRPERTVDPQLDLGEFGGGWA